MEGQEQEPGLCECGCGERTTVADRDDATYGWTKGEPKRFIRGHNHRRVVRYVVTDTGHPTFCWIWRLAKDERGYGKCRHEGKMGFAHRVYYEERFGPIPRGKQIDHLCRMPSCVNPDHLEAVTARENVRRGAATKLTQMAVREIRSSRESQEVLARRYGISQAQVSRVKNRRSWREL